MKCIVCEKEFEFLVTIINKREPAHYCSIYCRKIRTKAMEKTNRYKRKERQWKKKNQ